MSDIRGIPEKYFDAVNIKDKGGVGVFRLSTGQFKINIYSNGKDEWSYSDDNTTIRNANPYNLIKEIKQDILGNDLYDAVNRGRDYRATLKEFQQIRNVIRKYRNNPEGTINGIPKTMMKEDSWEPHKLVMILSGAVLIYNTKRKMWMVQEADDWPHLSSNWVSGPIKAMKEVQDSYYYAAADLKDAARRIREANTDLTNISRVLKKYYKANK